MNAINGAVFVEDPSNEGAFNRFQPHSAGPSVAMLQAVTEFARQRGAQYQPAGQEKTHAIRVFLDETALAERLIVEESRSGKSPHPYVFAPRCDIPETTS